MVVSLVVIKTIASDGKIIDDDTTDKTPVRTDTEQIKLAVHGPSALPQTPEEGPRQSILSQYPKHSGRMRSFKST